MQSLVQTHYKICVVNYLILSFCINILTGKQRLFDWCWQLCSSLWIDIILFMWGSGIGNKCQIEFGAWPLRLWGGSFQLSFKFIANIRVSWRNYFLLPCHLPGMNCTSFFSLITALLKMPETCPNFRIILMVLCTVVFVS